MCDCSSCAYTDKTGRDGFKYTPAESDILRFQSAKQSGRIPKDPAYTKHFNYCHPISATPPASFKYGQPARFTCNGTRFAPESLNLPAYGWQTTAEYIQGFDEKNSLKPVEYAYSWGPTDMRSESIAA